MVKWAEIHNKPEDSPAAATQNFKGWLLKVKGHYFFCVRVLIFFGCVWAFSVSEYFVVCAFYLYVCLLSLLMYSQVRMYKRLGLGLDQISALTQQDKL